MRFFFVIALILVVAVAVNGGGSGGGGGYETPTLTEKECNARVEEKVKECNKKIEYYDKEFKKLKEYCQNPEGNKLLCKVQIDFIGLWCKEGKGLLEELIG